MTDDVSSLMFEAVLNSVRDMPRQMQRMINAVTAMQETMPMPADGWEQFVRDIEYTNEKHNFALSIPCLECEQEDK